jgi:hypothetical protein
VLDRCAAVAAARGLDPRYVRELWAVVIEETCRIEERLLGVEQPHQPCPLSREAGEG